MRPEPLCREAVDFAARGSKRRGLFLTILQTEHDRLPFQTSR